MAVVGTRRGARTARPAICREVVSMKRILSGATALASLALAVVAEAADKLKIGVTATLEGT